MPTTQRAHPLETSDRLIFGLLLVLGFVAGLRGIYHYGYVGQDFYYHRNLILSYPGGYSYVLTNPPGLYWLGSLVYHHVSGRHYLEILAGIFLVLNTAALAILFHLLARCIEDRILRWAAATFLTFAPFRVIHSIVIAADAFTIPVFVLVAWLTLRLFAEPRRAGTWLLLALVLSAGLYCKYTFAGVLPALAIILAVVLGRNLQQGERLRWGTIAFVALTVPSLVFLSELRESWKVKGANTTGHWLPANFAPIMRWSDILTVQASDAAVFSAPEYMEGELYVNRKYSYLALVHVAAFTDCLNLFQSPPPDVPLRWEARITDDVHRTRSPFSQRLQIWAVRCALPFSILAVVGTLVCGTLSLGALLFRPAVLPPATVVLTSLAGGYYGLIFFSLHRVVDPYGAGYWVPRLVMPALLVFFALGFVLLDNAHRRLGRGRPAGQALRWGVGGFTMLTCALFAGFLW